MMRSVDPLNDPAWRDLMTTPRGGLFGSPPWLTTISDTYGFEISAHVALDDTGRAKSGLAFAQIEDFLGARQLSVPFCDYIDPVVDSDGDWRELVDPVLDRNLPLQLRVLNAEPPRRDPRFAHADEMAWHYTTLERDEDALFGALHARARQNVRAARRHGVTVRFGSDLEDVRAFHDLHRRTRKHKYRLLAQPVSFFENIWKNFAADDSIAIGLAEHDGDVIAGALYLVWNDTWYYKFGASNFERSTVRPNELLGWESMLRANERGCATYDWGVSDLDQPGLVAYKRKFATDERRVSVLRHVPAGSSNRVAAEALPVFGELTKLLTREDVPDDVTQRAGEILYRYFT
jgi:CelD/BcsL family acetyltransferase involved in cellulose biosynthesis